MKLLVMAAGRGTRISRYIEGMPKCTVDIGDTRLVEYTIQKFLDMGGISRIGIVLGYRSEILEEILSGYPVEFYYNYFYEVTNSIASAWFAKDFIDDDMVMMNADVFAEEKIFDMLLSEECRDALLLSDSSRKEMADYKFYYEDGQLIKFGKELEGDDISGEYGGIARLSKGFLPEFKARLHSLIKEGRYNMWWEDAIYSFVGERPVHVKDVAGSFWAEVDFIEDYERILKFRGAEGEISNG